ncbi:MAG: hypothetical protein KDA88_09985 [Planctomycetaceae bacterium]|nr:hypothetical protein [Planctomycetaceae bacterium]MCB9953939.1 hypothetical protein [Planctomycetaceae bacterium]
MSQSRLAFTTIALIAVLTASAVGQDQNGDSVASFIHPDFCATVVVHPSQIAKSELGKQVQFPALVRSLIEQADVDADTAMQFWGPDKVTRLTALIDPLTGGDVGFLPGLVVEFQTPATGFQAIRALWPDSRVSTTDNSLLVELDTLAGEEIRAYIANPRTVLIAPASTLEKMRNAPQNAANQLRRQFENDFDNSGLMVTYVSGPALKKTQELTGLNSRELRDDEQTDEFVKTLLLDVLSFSFKLSVDARPTLNLKVNCKQATTAVELSEMLNGGVDTLVLAISTPESRKVLKQEFGTEVPSPVTGLIDSPAMRDFIRALQFERHGKDIDLSLEIPKPVLDLASKSSLELAESAKPIPDDGNWVVMFRSESPKFWNTNTNDGPNRFAIPLSRAPSNIKYLRLKHEDGSSVIIEMSKSQLGKQFERGQFGWVGTNLNQWNGRHLGIYDRRWTDNERGSVHIWPLQNRGIRGWGFGNHVKIDDGQWHAWGGKTIPKTVFEISVKSGQLTAEERQALLK